jgi:hypothetical protein
MSQNQNFVMKVNFYINKNYGIAMGTALMLQVTGFSDTNHQDAGSGFSESGSNVLIVNCRLGQWY